MEVIDRRPKVAVYSLYKNKRDRRAVELLYAFCAVSGLSSTFYLDKSIPAEGQPPGWQRLCADVEAGKFEAVITSVELEVPGLAEWCAARGVRFEQVNPFEFSVAMRERALLR